MNERNAHSLPGLPVLLAFFVVAIANVAWLVDIVRHRPAEAWAITVVIVIFVLLFLAMIGLFQVQPNQGVVLQLFGSYSGTVREPGLRWANPFCSRRAISLRVRNFESSKLKVNDSDGNPIEIAAIVVW